MKIFVVSILTLIISNCLLASDPLRTITCAETGRKITFVTSGKYANTIAYPTCRTWSADGKWIFIESTRPGPDGKQTPRERQLIKINVETGETRHLFTIKTEDTKKYGDAQFGLSSQHHFDYAPQGNVIVCYDICGHNMYLINAETGESKLILHEPEGTIGDPPAITPDGKRVVYYVIMPIIRNRFFGRGMSVVFALDVDPETLQAVGEPKIITTYPARLEKGGNPSPMPDGVVVNHCQVNPKNCDHYIYSHQYLRPTEPSLMYTRCWENVDGLDRPIIAAPAKGWQTHEVCGPLGNGLYLIENWNLVYVDFKTKKVRNISIDNAKRACHITVSPDERWVVADMFYDDNPDENYCYNSGLLLINVETGKYDVVCKFKRGKDHPAHPHPNFCPDGKRVAFVVADGKSTCQVGIVDISDLMIKLSSDK